MNAVGKHWTIVGVDCATEKEAQGTRKRILERLRDEIDTGTIPPEEIEGVTKKDDLLDGVVCVLAGADFVRGEALPPVDSAKAKREGWIWFRGHQGSHVVEHGQ